jgi:hypothetical protein
MVMAFSVPLKAVNSWPDERVLASQEGLCFMNLVVVVVIVIVIIIIIIIIIMY